MMMRMMWILLGLFLFIALLTWRLLRSAPKLPSYAWRMVEELPKRPIPQLVSGVQGYAQSGSVQIWYEHIGDTRLPPILLVNGMGGEALTWSHVLIEGLLEKGFSVIRFDHRDIGASDKMVNWKSETPYTLEDMAQDALSVLDTLGIDRVHIMGYSMGGMIAQRIGLSHPQRVKSLVLVSTSGYMGDPELTALTLHFKWQLARMLVQSWVATHPQSEIIQNLEAQTLLRGGRALTRREVNFWMNIHRFNQAHSRRKHKAVGEHQVQAIIQSGSRLDELKGLITPTLVFHGKEDPLILWEHGKKYAPLIPDAHIQWIEGVGHILTDFYASKILDSLGKHFHQFN